jgi:uncharacterized membrane protein required for colicin V production
MNVAVIIDIVIVLVLVAFTVYGTKRGLFQSLAGLMIVVIALFGAAIVAGTFAKPVAKVAAPLVEKHFAEQIQDVLDDTLQNAVSEDEITEVISGLPEDGFLSGVMGNVGTALEGAADSAAQAASVAVERLVESFAYGLLFILAFILLLILLRVLCAAMGLLTKLPGVHGLNALGGAAFGLVEGVLLVFLVVFMLRNLGISLDAAVLQEAHILRIFRENTPISILMSLL